MSIKLKISLVVVIILALVAGSIIFFSKRDVEQAVFDSEQRSAKNVLRLVELDVRGRYKNLLMERLGAVRTLRSQLKRLNSVVVSGIGQFHSMSTAKRLSSKQAKQRALDWISTLDIGKDEYLFVFDKEGKALSYPNKERVGKSLTMFLDVKGRSVVTAMYDEAKKYGSAGTTYFWDKADGMGLEKKFGQFTYFPEWDWVLGTAVSIEDIEQKEQKRLETIISILEDSLSEVSIAKTGYVFVFTGADEVLIAPEQEQALLSASDNELTGNKLLDDFKAAAKESSDQPMQFIPGGEAGKGMREAYVTYFKTLDWYIATTVLTSEIQEPAKRLVERQSGVIAIVLLIGLLFALLVVVRITGPLVQLTEHAKVLHEQDFMSDEESESPIVGLAERSRDEVGRLAGAFVFMEKSLRERIRDLLETTAAKERIESELGVAHDIQMGLLPKIFPAFPDRKEIDLYATIVPAKEVGGDLYDFFFLDEDHLCFTVGDVSDKGVPASLFMAITMTLIRSASDRYSDPAKVMVAVNDVLSRDNPKSMFVTLWIGVLNLKTGHVVYSNGGHNPPVKISPETGAEWMSEISGPIVGAMEDMEYAPHEMTLKPGEAIYVYSDGVTEAMNATKELYSDPRLLDTCADLLTDTAEVVLGRIQADVEDHVQGAPASDDITMLCVRYKGADGQG